MKTVFSHPVCPHIVAEWAICGQEDRCSKRQSLCLLRDLDRNAFAGIFYAATATMKAVIIACSEVKPQGILAWQEFSQIDVWLGQVFFRPFLRRGDAYCQAMPQSTSLPRPTSDRRASLDCRVGWGCPRW